MLYTGQKIFCSVCATIALALAASCAANPSSDAVESTESYDGTFEFYMDRTFGALSSANRYYDVEKEKAEIGGESCVQLSCSTYDFRYNIAIGEDSSAVYGWFPGGEPEYLGDSLPAEGETEGEGDVSGELMEEWLGRFNHSGPDGGYPDALVIEKNSDRELEISVPDGTYNYPSYTAIPYLSPSGAQQLNISTDQNVVRLELKDDDTIQLTLLYSLQSDVDMAEIAPQTYTRRVLPVPDTAPPEKVVGRWARDGIYGEGTIELREDYSFYEYCDGDYYGQGYGEGYYLMDDENHFTLYYEDGSEGQKGKEAQLTFAHDYCMEYAMDGSDYYYWADVMSEDDPNEVYYTIYGTEYESAVTEIAGYWLDMAGDKGVTIEEEGSFRSDLGKGRCLFEGDTLRFFSVEKELAQWKYLEDGTMEDQADGEIYRRD